MSTPMPLLRRAALAATVASASVLLAVLAQGVATGAVPSRPSLAVAVAMVAGLALAVAREGRRPGPGTLLLTQLGLHAWFVLSGPQACGLPGGLGSVGPHRAVVSCLDAAGSAAATPHALGLLALHLLPVGLATLVASGLVGHADRLLDALGAAAAAVATVFSAVRPARPVPVPVPIRVDDTSARRRAVEDDLPRCSADLPLPGSRRGPPRTG